MFNFHRESSFDNPGAGFHASLMRKGMAFVGMTWVVTWLVAMHPSRLLAWDYDYHRMVNQVALQSLPAEFPDWIRDPAVRERIAFLAGDPDRWRNLGDPTLRHVNVPEHFIDLDDLPKYGLTIESLSPFRSEYLGQLAIARSRNPERFPEADPSRDPDRTRGIPGLLPWRITEDFARLQSTFSSIKAYEQFGGTPAEIANARANAVYLMGVMGHFIGDTAQPLHTSRHYNGWVGENPKGYTTQKTFHGWVDGGYLRKVGFRYAEISGQVRPARLVWDRLPGVSHEHLFPVVMHYVVEQSHDLERVYQLDKAGGLSGEGVDGGAGRKFLSGQIVRGGQMLGDVWYTAWKTAPKDTFLQSQLARRAGEESPKSTVQGPKPGTN